MDLSFLIVFLTNIFFDPAGCQNFGNALGIGWLRYLTVCLIAPWCFIHLRWPFIIKILPATVIIYDYQLWSTLIIIKILPASVIGVWKVIVWIVNFSSRRGIEFLPNWRNLKENLRQRILTERWNSIGWVCHSGR